jgi:site-specific DNA-methyltransferase (adenine-specific)
MNKVIQGDCLEVMKTIPDKSIDMILCDLPYGTTACKWDTIIPFEPLWEQYKKIIKDNGAIVLTASQPFTSTLVMSNIKMFKYELIWDKKRGFEPQLANIRPQKSHENIVVFCKGKTIYNPQKILLEKSDKRVGSGRKNNRLDGTGHNILSSITLGEKEYKDRFPLSIQFFSNANQKEKTHPTQKPVALFEYLIKTYTNENDLILDNCAGSGTTGVACKNTNRNYILIEKEQEYIDIINKRLTNL